MSSSSCIVLYSLCTLTLIVSVNSVLDEAAAASGGRSKTGVAGGEIDLQTCIDNFEVHKDKIIRTQDSRDMGAQYLNEIDLGSREECLRLCCETATCDVFIFEEKNQGSCYLFHCGPSEDFKCKFTHHDNYSSGILSIPRQQHDLERQIKLTKHEQDLSKLRKPAEAITDGKALTIKTFPTTVSTTTKKTKEVIPADPPTKAPPERVQARKCSRYQFECRANRECIAIYNVCDGIPQCSDGSDEGSELNCPEQAQSTAAPALRQPPPPPQRPAYIPITPNHPAIVNGQRPSSGSGGVQVPEIIYHAPPAQDRISASAAGAQRPVVIDQDFIRPPPRTPMRQNVPSASGMYGAPAGEAQPYRQNPVAGMPDAWVPHQSNQLQPLQNYPATFNDKNSHIFNHKESGLQVPEGPDGRYFKHKGALQTLHRALGYDTSPPLQGPIQYGEAREYPKLPNYYGEMYRQQMQEQWPARIGDNQNNQYIAPPPNRIENWPGNSMQNVNEQNMQIYKPMVDPQPKDVSESVIPLPKMTKSEHAEAEKMVHELKHSSANSDGSHSNVDLSKHREKIIQTHQQHSHNHGSNSEYKMAQVTDLQDGETETPGGAVLSLTLGVILTCVMGILIGCRLRVVHRRMRRGGKSPYAHDADYLVNGMYL